jgi:group II intron reverse transcriptase/maturase
MQRKLSQWATEDPAKRFVDLYSLLCNERWLRAAHHKVNSNQGRETAGIDLVSMSNFNRDLEVNLERLRATLKAKTFEPLPVRRVYIPKANGKIRPLGIPGIRDRIVQEALRMILEPIWEADFSKQSYGFRPNRSTYDAMTYIGKRLASPGGETFQWVIEGDIASYFDTIPHRRLMKGIKKRVADRDIRDLLWKFLRAGVIYNGKYSDTLTGTPQGGIVSPLLANIYLDELDRYMESTYLNLDKQTREKRRRHGKANYLYVRYADDFIVLCNGSKTEALAMKEELKGVLDTMGLTLSEEKTKVTHITEGFDFLGYTVIRSIGTKGKMVPKVLIPANAIKQIQYKVRGMLAPGTTYESYSAKIIALNGLIRGWCEYYRSTSSPQWGFREVERKLFWDMAHWLGKKYKVGIPMVLRTYMKGNTFGTNAIKLVLPSTYKAKRYMAKTWHNPYTEKEAIIREKIITYESLWTGTEHQGRKGYMDLREEVMLLKGTTCYLCGINLHPSEVEVDHDTPRARFKDKTEADRMKHLQPLCTSCHRAKTKADLKVLSRMR